MPEPIIIIGIAGRAHSGKDTVADFLVEHFGFVKQPMASPLKEAAKVIFLLTDEQVYGSLKEVVDPRWNMTPRRILQLLGTDAVKPTFGRDLWARHFRLAAENLVTQGQTRIVVPDIRHSGYDEDPDMEALNIHAMGGTVWHLIRDHASPLSEEAQQHTSEKGVRFYPARDELIDNRKDLDHLYGTVRAMTTEYLET